jgi:exodeoxyribonuclease III
LLTDVSPSPPPKRRSKGSPPPTNRSKPKASKSAKEDSDKGAGKEQSDSAADPAPAAPAKKTKAPRHQVLTERDEIPKLWNPDRARLVAEGSYRTYKPLGRELSMADPWIRTLSHLSLMMFPSLALAAMKIVSWNVCGLRALLNKTPDVLAQLVRDHDVDVLCLQETKLQESHVDELGLLNVIPGYDAYYSCSTARKGYSGTAAFVKKRRGVPSAKVVGAASAAASALAPNDAANPSNGKGGRKKQKTLDGFFAGAAEKKDAATTVESDDAVANANDAPAADDTAVADDGIPPEMRPLLVPESVSIVMGVDKHDAEGRVVILHFPSFTVCNLYVPNSGAGLVRLPYRVDEWDQDWLRYCQEARKAKPVMWLGDLNVAHTHLEVWNDGAPHLPKQAGVTAEERASFQHQLDAGYVDAFRRLHPDVKGHYSYWSQRANNRPSNKGLRLDYFVCDRSFFPDDDDKASDDDDDAGACKAVVRDSYILHDVLGSDHCPVVLELEVRL